jgi:hypothetical protein
MFVQNLKAVTARHHANQQSAPRRRGNQQRENNVGKMHTKKNGNSG